MRYRLRDDIDVDFDNQRRIANRIGISEVTLCNILKRKATTSKPIAFFIVYLNGGTYNEIEDYFELVEKGG